MWWYLGDSERHCLKCHNKIRINYTTIVGMRLEVMFIYYLKSLKMLTTRNNNEDQNLRKKILKNNYLMYYKCGLL